MEIIFASTIHASKAQVRAYISGDPVWEEAFHRDYLNENMRYFYKISQGIDPYLAENEYLPMPIQYRRKDGKLIANFRVQVSLLHLNLS